MSKIKIVLVFILLSLLFVSGLYPSSIDYRGNQSVFYIITLSRNAALDGTDIVHYNPAGTAFLKDGFHLNIGNQTLFKDYTMNFEGTEYASTKPTIILPNLYFAYKKDKLALFAAVTVPIGGGKVEYNSGIPMTALTKVQKAMLMYAYSRLGATGVRTDAFLHASSVSHGYTAGAAYQVADNLSVSAGLRFTRAWRKFDGEQKIFIEGIGNGLQYGTTIQMDGKEEATGICLILGLDYKVSDKLNLALKYESSTHLTYKMKIYDNKNFNGLWLDGQKIRRDIPSLFAFGADYAVSDRLSVSASLVYYFIESATGDVFANYSNGADISFGFTYKAVPEKLSIYGGYLYAPVGGDNTTYTDLDFSLDAHNFSVGARIHGVAKGLDIIGGVCFSSYLNGFNVPETVEYDKKVFTFGIGCELEF